MENPQPQQPAACNFRVMINAVTEKREDKTGKMVVIQVKKINDDRKRGKEEKRKKRQDKRAEMIHAKDRDNPPP